MNTEKLQFNIPESTGKVEVVIREGKAEENIKPMPPVQINITGTLGAPYEFLEKRLEKAPINESSAHILVDRDKMTITLIMDESDFYKRGSVVGVLSAHPVFVKFGINTDKDWEPNKLGQFFKMNRAFFEDTAENMKLVSSLKNFSAKIDSLIEKQKDESGSYKDSYSAVVTSNLPEKFRVNIPFFIGGEKESFEVEFDSSINGKIVFLNLISPGANFSIETIRDTAIDAQLKEIRRIAPYIVIIEQ